MKSKRRQLEALRGAWKLETPAWLHEWLHRSDTVTARRIIEAEDPKEFLRKLAPRKEHWAEGICGPCDNCGHSAEEHWADGELNYSECWNGSGDGNKCECPGYESDVLTAEAVSKIEAFYGNTDVYLEASSHRSGTPHEEDVVNGRPYCRVCGYTDKGLPDPIFHPERYM